MDIRQTDCACGCGNTAPLGKRFISGHNMKGRLRKPRITRQCANCKGDFTGTAAGIGSRIYCSAACRNAHRAARVGRENPCYKRVTVPCGTCGQPVDAMPNALRRRGSAYCSPACGRAGRARKISAAARERPSQHWRDVAKRAYGDRCALCGFDTVVEVHHIQGRAKGGSNHVRNLIPLCPNHHAMVHAGLMSIRPRL